MWRISLYSVEPVMDESRGTESSALRETPWGAPDGLRSIWDAVSAKAEIRLLRGFPGPLQLPLRLPPLHACGDRLRAESRGRGNPPT